MRGVNLGRTYKKKLVIAPAPPAARESCPRVNSAAADCPEYHRMAFWIWLYETNMDAFSAIAPTIGAGRPYHPK